MRESHVEGVANHDDPEPASAPARAQVKRGPGARTGWVLSREMQLLRGADAVNVGGRQHDLRRYRETPVNPARSKTPCTYGTSLRENREISGTPTAML